MRSQSNRLRPDGNAGHLYYVRVRSRFGPLYKIGFTKSESVARRFNFKNNGDEKMLDAQFLFAYHEDAFNLEKRLHEHFSAKKAFGNFASYEHLPLYKNGQSELYPFDILGIDPDYTEDQGAQTLASLAKIGMVASTPKPPLWVVVIGTVLRWFFMAVWHILLLGERLLEILFRVDEKHRGELSGTRERKKQAAIQLMRDLENRKSMDVLFEWIQQNRSHVTLSIVASVAPSLPPHEGGTECGDPDKAGLKDEDEGPPEVADPMLEFIKAAGDDQRFQSDDGASMCDQMIIDEAEKRAKASKLRLTHVLKRTSAAGLGPFLDLYNDLAKLTIQELDQDPMIKMAYGYARRIATAGLYFQGVADEDHIREGQRIFQTLQATTGQTVAFQEEASAQANEAIKAYIPQATYSHLMIFSKYSNDHQRASDVASLPGVDFEMPFDEMQPPFSFSSCMTIADRLIQLGLRAEPGVIPGRSMRLIDLVEKRTNSTFGAFANMFEDIKACKDIAVMDPLLSAAAGQAMWLAAAGVFVAGGIKTDIVLESIHLMNIFTKDAKGEPDLMREGKAQALALAHTYGLQMNELDADEIMASAHEFVNFYVDEERRLSADEVIERARKRVKARIEGNPTE